MSEPTAKEVFAGSVTEIDSSGDYIVDTQYALREDVCLRLAQGRALRVEIAGVPVFEVSNDGSNVEAVDEETDGIAPAPG